jgi:hypothetical protein
MGVSGFDRTLLPHRSDWFLSTIGGRLDRRSPLSRRISERLRWRMPYVDARGIVDIAMRAVRETDPPLFVFVNLLDAHAPYNPPEQALTLLGVEVDPRFPRYWHHTELTRNWASIPEDAQACSVRRAGWATSTGFRSA